MGMYVNEYAKAKANLENWKLEAEQSVASLIKTLPNQKITIGNMVYSVMKLGCVDVPTYAYLADIHTEGNPYYPIWDRSETYEFGWSDFQECCRIFDVITDTILKKGQEV